MWWRDEVMSGVRRRMDGGGFVDERNRGVEEWSRGGEQVVDVVVDGVKDVVDGVGGVRREVDGGVRVGGGARVGGGCRREVGRSGEGRDGGDR